jgi:hypothetical protein
MDYQFTLRRFFVLVFLFVICPLVGWIAYAHRTNAPANLFAGDKPGEYGANSVTIPDDKLDMSTPFYQNDAAKQVEKETGRPMVSSAAEMYPENGEKSEKNEGETKIENPSSVKDSAKTEKK